MIPHAFGARKPLTLGVEEELFVVDPGTLRLAAAPDELFDGTRLKSELHRAVVELNTGICATPEEVAAELAELRVEARSRAGRRRTRGRGDLDLADRARGRAGGHA